jgi:hypothetical protein
MMLGKTAKRTVKTSPVAIRQTNGVKISKHNMGTNVQISQVRGRGLRLELFQDINFEGRRIVFDGGEVAVRDLRAFQFNDALSSFRVRNNVQRNRLTLVLFEDINYQGAFRVFRGSQNVSNLVNLGFNDQASSFVLVDERITNQRIQQIQELMRAPTRVLEIFM